MGKTITKAAIFSVLLMFASTSYQQPIRKAGPHEAARGEVIGEDATTIRIKTNPCAANSNVVIFQQPYKMENAGTVQCGGTTKSLVLVVQGG